VPVTAAALTPSLTSPLMSALIARPVEKPAAREGAVMAPSDEAIFLKARGGDRNALGELVARYERSLFGLLVRLTSGDKHRAEDMFQETFLHAMRAAETFKGGRQFKPWITAIAVNLVRDDARKRKVRGEVALETGAADPEENRAAMLEAVDAKECPSQSAERRDEESVVHRAMQRLTELEREVVLLHFFQGMTLVETAESLTVPVGTVKSRLHAALTRMATMLPKPRP
jgi:RNA polymerase sigma-70 factor (ECF subfamily)